MRTATYKGHLLGNSLNVFTYYKQCTGRGLQKDLAMLNTKSSIVAKMDPNKITPEELVKISDVESDLIMSGIYVALRKAGDTDARRKSTESILDELETQDLSDPELINVVVSLLGSKKE